MSTTDGDASSRLENALADVFSNAPTLPPREAESSTGQPAPAAPPEDDWSVDDPDDDHDDDQDDVWGVEARDDGPVEIPEIVPATEEPMTRRATPSPTPTPAPAPAAPAPPTGPAAAAAPVTGWGDHMADLSTTVPAGAQGAPLRAPGRKPRVRRVTRVLRHIDPWSTFKVALLFSVVAYLVSLTAGVLLWRVADSTGTLDNIERWFTQFGWETFELDGGEIFHNAWIIGLFAAVALTGTLVLLATLFNLVSDIVGGVRMTVLEEEVVERTVSSTRRYVVRRAPTSEATVEEDWDIDDDGAEPTSPDPDVADGADREANTRTTVVDEVASADDWTVDDDDDLHDDRDDDVTDHRDDAVDTRADPR